MEGRRRTARQQLKPLLLWCEYSFTPQDREPHVAAAHCFRVAYTTRPDRALEDVANLKPAALCFDLDHLDPVRARTLEDVMGTHPRLPALLLTVEHSEELAVWAFRTGVWNFLVKPVAQAELSANLERMALAALRRNPVHQPRPPNAPSPGVRLASPADVRVARLEPALQYVRRHYADKLAETEAARRCGMKRFAFSHAFHAVFGLTFREYVTNTRIGEARRLLSEGGHRVTEVALATGFSDASHFARTFREHTGVLPSEYGAEHTTVGPASFPAP
jgi:AraC-like DNA-binding protein